MDLFIESPLPDFTSAEIFIPSVSSSRPKSCEKLMPEVLETSFDIEAVGTETLPGTSINESKRRRSRSSSITMPISQHREKRVRRSITPTEVKVKTKIAVQKKPARRGRRRRRGGAQLKKRAVNAKSTAVPKSSKSQGRHGSREGKS